MGNILYVALGGALGSVLRYLGVTAVNRISGPGWPVGTFMVNILGSLIMGMLAAWLTSMSTDASERWRLLLGVGVLGGFTTFSAFSLEAVSLIETRDFFGASGYVAGSVLVSLVALWVGLMLARRLFT
jgi:CrcB protein